MVLGKIVVKNNYEQKGDLVFRPLIRAYKNNGFDAFIDGDKALILGIIRDNVFYELFTSEVIPYANYEVIGSEEFNGILDSLSYKEIKVMKKAINSVIFKKENETKYDEALEEQAFDRAIEFNAYNHDLSIINPYEEPVNGYNDFDYKCKVLKKIS